MTHYEESPTCLICGVPIAPAREGDESGTFGLYCPEHGGLQRDPFEEEWAKIEAVSPVPLDPRKVGEVTILATAVHPLKEQILERTSAGERFLIRLMEPDWKAVDAGENVPIMAQVYLDGPPEFISVVTTSILSFAAEPDSPPDA